MNEYSTSEIYRKKVAPLVRELLPVHYRERGPRKHAEVLICLFSVCEGKANGIRGWLERKQIEGLNLEEDDVYRFLIMYDLIESDFFELEYCPVLIRLRTLKTTTFHKIIVQLSD